MNNSRRNRPTYSSGKTSSSDRTIDGSVYCGNDIYMVCYPTGVTPDAFAVIYNVIVHEHSMLSPQSAAGGVAAFANRVMSFALQRLVAQVIDRLALSYAEEVLFDSVDADMMYFDANRTYTMNWIAARAAGAEALSRNCFVQQLLPAVPGCVPQKEFHSSLLRDGSIPLRQKDLRCVCMLSQVRRPHDAQDLARQSRHLKLSASSHDCSSAGAALVIRDEQEVSKRATLRSMSVRFSDDVSSLCDQPPAGCYESTYASDVASAAAAIAAASAVAAASPSTVPDPFAAVSMDEAAFVTRIAATRPHVLVGWEVSPLLPFSALLIRLFHCIFNLQQL